MHAHGNTCTHVSTKACTNTLSCTDRRMHVCISALNNVCVCVFTASALLTFSHSSRMPVIYSSIITQLAEDVKLSSLLCFFFFFIFITPSYGYQQVPNKLWNGDNRSVTYNKIGRNNISFSSDLCPSINLFLSAKNNHMISCEYKDVFVKACQTLGVMKTSFKR